MILGSCRLIPGSLAHIPKVAGGGEGGTSSKPPGIGMSLGVSGGGGVKPMLCQYSDWKTARPPKSNREGTAKSFQYDSAMMSAVAIGTMHRYQAQI